MIIRFGLEFHDQVYPDWDEKVDAAYSGRSFLSFLEEQLGLGYPENQAFLRVEQFRQVLQYYLDKHPKAFYAASFEADPLATSEALLSRRDELFLASWDFSISANMPSRLKTLAEIEQLLGLGLPVGLSAGFAERFVKVMYYLKENRKLSLEKVYLNEPLKDLAPHWQQLFEELSNKGVELIPAIQPKDFAENDLGRFQKALNKDEFEKGKVNADGSLIILKAKSETYAATYLSKLFRLNADYRPLCLLSEKNRALDNALVQEGLPSFGVVSASLARPSLQILKLVSAFLWNPINPYRLLEFLSLPNIPLNKELALKLAEAISQKPGLFSPLWYKKRKEFEEELNAKMQKATKKQLKSLEETKEKAEKEYKFWFERRRYDIRKQVPVDEVIDVFEYVQHWAIEVVDDLKSKIDALDKKLNKKQVSKEQADQLEYQREELVARQSPMLTLYEQSSRIVQLLETLPEKEKWLSYLQLERFVKTINEAVAIPFRPTEVGHAPFIYQPSAIAEICDQMLWWNFVEPSQKAGFARWYPKEVEFLQKLKIELDSTSAENNRQLWQRMRPVLLTQKQLILVLPEQVDGREVNPHPLWGDLHATFGDAIDRISVNLDSEHNSNWLASFFQLPNKAPVDHKPLNQPRPFIYINNSSQLKERNSESFTSLENLFYYPYQWVFQYLIRLHKSSILSVVNDNRLLGNLAHTVFEKLFEEIKESDTSWNKQEVESWIDGQLPPMFEREGAVLLMYGHEAERVGFINRIKRAAWSLISAIQNNGWKIYGTEVEVKGKLVTQEISGIADLVLEREGEKAVVDLKWKGKGYRRDHIRSMEDLQLVIYSKLITGGDDWAHTAYYIMNDASLLARNQLAFQEAEAISPDLDFRQVNQEIWNKMEQTYIWRMEQIKSGQIEIRNEINADLIEKEMLNTHELLSLLEMRKTDPSYDNFKVLVNAYK
jgi:ATP-dependent helicase/nuclease subunit B